MTELVEISVSGRVQGVGYREFARRAAERHGVAGFVRNCSDGTVEARLVGEADALEAALAELRRGPSHGYVHGVKIVARGEAAAESGFRVEATRYGFARAPAGYMGAAASCSACRKRKDRFPSCPGLSRHPRGSVVAICAGLATRSSQPPSGAVAARRGWPGQARPRRRRSLRFRSPRTSMADGRLILFTNVLIANRGEIACRIMATAKRMGLETIALHTPVDAGARFTRLADRTVEVPSYLDAQAIVAAAKAAGAQCLHPGYGFLSENADFAEYCAIEDIVFVGPPPEAMRAMGLKSSAKAVVARTGAAVVPGYYGENQTAKFMKERAYQLGYPVLIKAIAGGGGRGIRRVDSHIEFESALESAQREAEASFGDGRVLIEKLIASPRHIEVQVFGDSHGHVVHLYERDCSLQRRRQKLIEETPAPGLPAPTRAAMTEAAVAAAKAVGYVGAGTVEYIVDASKGMARDAFYFMEMNTRLQVEHPVTEALLGIDLVEWQFRVAAGEPLPLSQEQIVPRGCAVEARVNAEDPETGFLPSPGLLRALRLDDLGVRVDSGVEQGDVVSPHYDSLIAKLIAHADTREEAIAKLDAALARAVVIGPKTNIAFLRALLAAPEYRDGRHDTGYIDAHLSQLGAVKQPLDARAALAGVEAIYPGLAPAPASEVEGDPWSRPDAFELMAPRRLPFEAEVDGAKESFVAIARGAGVEIAFRDGRAASAGAAPTVLAVDDGVLVLNGGRQTHVAPPRAFVGADEAPESDGVVRAPMHGRLIALAVSEGEVVEAGARIAVLEAMKMEHALTAPRAGRVTLAGHKVGDVVEPGEVVASVEG